MTSMSAFARELHAGCRTASTVSRRQSCAWSGRSRLKLGAAASRFGHVYGRPFVPLRQRGTSAVRHEQWSDVGAVGGGERLDAARELVLDRDGRIAAMSLDGGGEQLEAEIVSRQRSF